MADLWNAVESHIYGTRQELEAAGAETAGMLESTTQLRDLVQELTGFDIMTDSAGTQLKDLYSIIVGIGQEWSAFSASDQNGLLKGIVDFGNGTVNVLDFITDKLGALGTLGTIGGAVAGAKNLG